MDKYYTSIGILFIILALGMMYWQGQQIRRQTGDYSETSTEPVEETDPADVWSPLESQAEVLEKAPAESPSLIARSNDKPRSAEAVPIEEIYILENEFIRVDFTSFGGAIRQVALKKHLAVQGEPDLYVFNQYHEVPALSISLAGADGSVTEYAPPYNLVRQDSESIEFALELLPGVKLLREYVLSGSFGDTDPYIIKHTTRFINGTSSVFNIDRIFVNVGTAAPTEADRRGFYLNVGYFDGEDVDFVSLSKFKGSSVLGFFRREPAKDRQDSANTVWVSVKNQFFTAILTPAEAGTGIYSKPVSFPVRPDQKTVPEGITGSIEFDLQSVAAHSERLLEIEYYVGPKEYSRLSGMEQRQDLVMQFGFFGFISKMLLYMLIGLERLIGSYGVAIIIMTIIIRMVLWPLTAKAARSSKQMAKVQEPLKEIREKYKDNPDKLNKETLKLFKEHKVNPAAGCLPIFVQIPIFFALFGMLRSATELRFAPFLWVNDLSLPDTIGTIGSFPLNPLPLVMGVSMFYQMRMTPAAMDKTQQRIFQFMPFIFLIFCYSFSSGLVLYWTVSNFISILQQVITNKSKDPEETAPSVPATQKGKRKRR